MTRTAPCKFRADLLQIFSDLVAVFGVVYHDEQHRFFAEPFVLGIALAPFLDAELPDSRRISR